MTGERTFTREPAQTRRLRAPHDCVGAFGLALIALAPIVVVAVSLVGHLPTAEAAAGLVPAAVVGTAGLAVLRYGRWANAAGLVVAVLAVVAFRWLLRGLAYPASLADFVPAVVAVLGVALAVVGNAMALGTRRGTADGWTRGDRLAVAGAAVLVVLTVASSAGLFLAARSGVPAGASRADVVVTMRGIVFEPDEIYVPAREGLVLVRNEDLFFHTFTIPSLGLNARLVPGEAALVAIDAPPGSYVFYCAPHADMSVADPAEAGMAGILYVR